MTPSAVAVRAAEDADIEGDAKVIRLPAEKNLGAISRDAVRQHAADVLIHPNYNDDPDPGVTATVRKIVDTSKIIEIEHVNPDTLPSRKGYRFVKRAFDIASCIVALVICAIPMAIIAVAVKSDSPGPVFYRQQRLGYMGKPISIVKFRSMRDDAEAQGAQWAQGEDPRVTRVGAFLRKTRLDELPQFWAVVKGDLSLIGPRPEREVFYNEFEKYIHGFSQRMLVKPGMTCYWQTRRNRDTITFDEWVDLDLCG